MPSKLNPVTIVLRGVDRVTGTANKVATRLKAMQKPVRDLSRALSELNKQSGFSRVMDKATALGSSFARLARNALLAGSAIGVAAVAGMRRFISSADALDEAAAAAGVSVEKLQEVRFAGSFAGLGEAQVDKLMVRFSRTLGEVRRGTGALTNVLKKSNPELLKQFRAVKSVDEGFTLFMRTLDQIPDQRLRNVFAVAAAGTGAERLTLIADSYEMLTQKARDAGVIMDRQTVDQAVRAQAELQELGAVVQGLGIQIGGALLPVVLEITGKIREWINENRDLIKTKVPEFARELATQVREVSRWLFDVTPKAVAFVDSIGGLKTVLAGIAAVILGPVIASFVSLSAVLLTTPFGGVLIGLTAIGAAIAAIYLNWDRLKASFASVPDWVKGVWSGAISPTAAGAPEALDLMKTSFFGGGRQEVGGTVRLEISGAPVKNKGMESFGGLGLELLGPSLAGGF